MNEVERLATEPAASMFLDRRRQRRDGRHQRLHLAEPLFRRLMREVELWLVCGRVHADLSPFNILYWQGEPTVIDFLQAIDPETNPNASELLARDVGNVCRFFARFGVRADDATLTAGLWRRFLRRDLYV